MSLSIWIDLLTNTSFTNGIYMILLKTMVCYWACIRFPKVPVISNLCWLGVVSSNVLLFLILFRQYPTILIFLIFSYSSGVYLIFFFISALTSFLLGLLFLIGLDINLI
jgi:hypothetical protein